MTSKTGGRQDRLKVRVKTAKRRSAASTRWLQRQLNDPYVAKARSEGYRSRAAYKLAEIDDKYGFLKPGARVVDLGAAPGGWSQVAAERVGAAQGKGKVVAIDILEMDPVAGVEVLHLDFLDETAPDQLRAALGGPADVVLSDIAPPTTGHKQTDHLRIMGMCETALEFAREVLAPGGTFLAKVLRGGTETQMLNDMKRDFDKVRHVKPPASRADSAELYVMATGFRGGQAPEVDTDNTDGQEA